MNRSPIYARWAVSICDMFVPKYKDGWTTFNKKNRHFHCTWACVGARKHWVLSGARACMQVTSSHGGVFALHEYNTWMWNAVNMHPMPTCTQDCTPSSGSACDPRTNAEIESKLNLPKWLASTSAKNIVQVLMRKCEIQHLKDGKVLSGNIFCCFKILNIRSGDSHGFLWDLLNGPEASSWRLPCLTKGGFGTRACVHSV